MTSNYSYRNDFQLSTVSLGWLFQTKLDQMKNMETKTMKILHSLIAGPRPLSSIPARWISFPLLSLCTASMMAQFCRAAPIEFELTGSLATAREAHTATLPSNGKVLVAGGWNGSALATAELYDPATGTWTATGSLVTSRWYHRATLLPNGKVLVEGGVDDNGVPLASAELGHR
jgi:hypothetical protein